MNPFVLILILSVGVFLIGIIGWLKKIQHQKVEKVYTLFSETEIQLMDASANYFGTKSKGMGQVRGNGILVLTHQEIYYEMWTPEKVVRIPKNQIRSVKTAKSFLGKSKGGTLIVIEYINEQNEADASAWQVRNVSEWIKALN